MRISVPVNSTDATRLADGAGVGEVALMIVTVSVTPT